MFVLQATNAYLKFLRGPGVISMFEFVKEMPKSGTELKFDFSSILGGLFFTWIIEMLFPVSFNVIILSKINLPSVLVDRQYNYNGLIEH